MGEILPLRYSLILYENRGKRVPGTRIDLKNVRDYKPYSGVDSCSRTHDLAYEAIGKRKDLSKAERAKLIHQADEEALKCYDKYKGDKTYNLAKLGIQGKLDIESILSALRGEESTFYGGKRGCSCLLCKKLKCPYC